MVEPLEHRTLAVTQAHAHLLSDIGNAHLLCLKGFISIDMYT
jgi:hypothetical protein